MGELAVQELNQISGLLNDVIYHQLDIGDRESILSLRKFIEESMEKWGFKGLDILVNNAGKFFMYVTKARANLSTYSRKSGNYNCTIFLTIDIMKKSSLINLKFTFLALSKPTV